MAFVNNTIKNKLYYLLEFFLILLPIALISSTTLTTIVDAGLFLTWLLYGYSYNNSFKGILNQFSKFFKDKACLSFTLIYLLSIIGLIYSANIKIGIKELIVKMPLLFMPIFFSGFPKIKEKTINKVVISHCLILFFASIIILIKYLKGNYNYREYYPFISHIRLSLNYCLSCIILFYYLIKYKKLSKTLKIIIPIIIIWFVITIIIIKTLTGIGAIIIVSLILILTYNNKSKNILSKSKIIATTLFIILLITTIGYFYYAHNKYYNLQMDITNTDKYTINGNEYTFNHFDEDIIEEGYYINSYVCEKELLKEWNKRSNYNLGINNNIDIKATLIRYLNSLGYRKDSVGMSKLTDRQIRDIEQGIANVNYTKIGLYSRISSSFFSYEVFKRNGDPQGSSILQRIFAWKIGTKAIYNKPIFGYGTGNVLSTLDIFYNKYYPNFQDRYRISTHNQYIFFTIQSGLIGLIIFIFGFIYPGINKRKFSDFLWKTIFILAIFSMLFEDTLGTQTGVTFVTFFYFLFLFNDDKQLCENKN